MPDKGPQKETALVVHSIRHGETSRIINLFTKKKGLVSVIAKGSRRGKSGSALGTIDPPSSVEAVVYYKHTRSVQTLGQVSLLNSFRGIKSNLQDTALAAVVLQYIYRAFTQGEENQDAFSLTQNILLILDSYSAVENDLESETDQQYLNTNRRLTLWLFQLLFIRALGFEINLFNCPVCDKQINSLGFKNNLLVEAGGICCDQCSPGDTHKISLSGESVMILRRLTLKGEPNLGKLRISENSRREITNGLHRFLSYHHTGLGKFSAIDLIEQLDQPLV